MSFISLSLSLYSMFRVLYIFVSLCYVLRSCVHSKALITHNIFAHNIATKVSSNKNLMYLVFSFDKSLPWPIDIHSPKISV